MMSICLFLAWRRVTYPSYWIPLVSSSAWHLQQCVGRNYLCIYQVTRRCQYVNDYFSFFFYGKKKKKLFDEKWHQLRLLVTEDDVTLYVDDLEIESLSLEPSVGIFINGKTQVGKYVQKDTTVPVSLSLSHPHFIKYILIHSQIHVLNWIPQ